MVAVDHGRPGGGRHRTCRQPRSRRACDSGSSLLATPLFVVFAAENPNAPFFFGIPAWILAAVFVGIDVLRIVGDRLWGTLVMMLAIDPAGVRAGAAVGFRRAADVHPQSRRRPASRTRPGAVRPLAGPTSRKSERRRSAQVVEGPWSAPLPPQSTADAAAAQVELDALLDKISATGLDSLTTDEKRRLNELSKRLR